jgi:hypothetical protein
MWAWFAAFGIWLVSAIVAWTLSDHLHEDHRAFLAAVPASILGGYLFVAVSLTLEDVRTLSVTLAFAPVALVYLFFTIRGARKPAPKHDDPA